MAKQRFWLFGGLLGLLLILLGIGFAFRPHTYRGTLIEPPLPIADFELIDQNGETFRFSTLRGKLVLLFFGYTYCPDICPITLAEFKQVKENLAQEAEKVRFVFVTVDPQRDSAEVLKRHLQNFDPQFIGLTGSEEDLSKVWKQFGAYRAIRQVEGSTNYLVDHTVRIYVVDEDQNLILTYPYDSGVKVLVEDVRHLLKGVQ
ncbi:MAG: SCO family protein [Anaerolineales bacterium]|nr:SCO family protein [Anaerolineales bacterium]MCS7247808.1 SCO family protein [Anaerolineales bacterium]MDW8161618.1 SCO family protein [Anaerolineales bacterium]MDW8446308.1 SCO family protein [Anaerolineales bacterium]